MKEHAQISPNHFSYQNHRRQFWLQILLPVLLAILLVVVVAVFAGLATFGEDGDSARWAAISTIWLVIPVMGFGLFFLLALAGLIYFLAWVLRGLPPYSAKAQYHTKRAAFTIRQFSDQAVKPVLFLKGIAASLKALVGK